MELVERTIFTLDKDETPINIFLDLSKAFDTLNHTILLNKLHHYGIRDGSLNLFKSYLQNRKQYVVINNAKSDILDITTGVPQGYILGPLLFIMIILMTYQMPATYFIALCLQMIQTYQLRPNQLNP